ncbi:MAG: hypothetical protein IJG02_10755 [Thermoguttaceae bacterium]|nr:hypothetical protein [Thermoguttaceae bacterium]
MKAILDQTDAIMLYGNIDESTEIGFNRHQIDEEKRKKEFLSKYSDKTEAVLSLEDHERLKGQISIVALKWLSQQDTTPDLDLADYADRFVSLFKCEYDLIDRALMSTGDYKQQDEKSWRYQYGSKSIMSAWDRLFHKSANKGFKDTSEILFKLLSSAKSFKDEHLRNSVDSFISCCKDNATYSWRYYYVNYESFRPGKYGKYHNNNPEKEPYMFSVMLTEERSRTTYMPYLKEADSNHLSDKGDCLIYGHWHIICQNNGYLFRNDESETKKEVCIPVVQKAGIDAEDRIELLKNLIKRLNDWTPEIIYDELLKFKGDQDQKQIEIDPAEKLGEK